MYSNGRKRLAKSTRHVTSYTTVIPPSVVMATGFPALLVLAGKVPTQIAVASQNFKVHCHLSTSVPTRGGRHTGILFSFIVRSSVSHSSSISFQFFSLCLPLYIISSPSSFHCHVQYTKLTPTSALTCFTTATFMSHLHHHHHRYDTPLPSSLSPAPSSQLITLPPQRLPSTTTMTPTPFTTTTITTIALDTRGGGSFILTDDSVRSSLITKRNRLP